MRVWPLPLYIHLKRCSNNNRQDKKHYRFTCWIHCIYILMQNTTARMLNAIISGTTELASVQLVLKRLGVCWWELISCHSQLPVCSLTFVLMWTRVENPASKSYKDSGGYYNLLAWGKLSEGWPKQLLWGRFGTFAQRLIAA